MDSTTSSNRPIGSEEKADMVREFADSLKAEDILVINIQNKTSVADYFVVCTGTSDVHVRAVADRVDEKMRAAGMKPIRSDTASAGWILLDYGDVIFHCMREETRQFYDLETLWSMMPTNIDLV